MKSRRGFLLGAAAVTVVAGGYALRDVIGPAVHDTIDAVRPAQDGPGQTCRTPESLTSFSTLGGAPLRYEISGIKKSFNADPRFVDQLQAWADDWVTVSGLGPLAAVSTYGAHVDKCGSWHAAGRAFDFGILTHADGTEVSCRFDTWGEDPGRLALYWRLAASLAKHFNYTLTYRFNEQHHNHIHIDNGVNGYDSFGFNEGSRAHVEMVQNVLRWVFGQDVPRTGEFDATTREAARAVQRSHAITGKLSSTAGWAAFLDAAASAT